MTVEDSDTDDAIANIKQILKEDKTVSHTLRAAIDVMIFLVSVLVKRQGLNSRNSSKPPSTDFGENKEKNGTLAVARPRMPGDRHGDVRGENAGGLTAQKLNSRPILDD